MRKYRVVVTAGERKLTRHVRAEDERDARRQALVIVGALLGAVDLPSAVVSVVEMGLVVTKG